MSNTRIVIVDYGMGNIRSVQGAFRRLGCDISLMTSADDLDNCDALILPGVGAFGEAMSNLSRLNLVEPLKRAVVGGKPILGICLGMQLLADSSEERGNSAGLSLIPGVVKRIPVPKNLRLPHVGWNSISVTKPAPLFTTTQDGDSFYFVHSFEFRCAPKHVAATTDYGNDVVAAVQRDHVFGVQFHPERSQAAGLRLLGEFVNYVQRSNSGNKVPC
jgi:imidazole glycerol-phosphate synthase subunit HisH